MGTGLLRGSRGGGRERRKGDRFSEGGERLEEEGVTRIVGLKEKEYI